jgi:hypothetical protein
MQKKALLTTAIASMMALPAVSNAELTANAGWVSDYIFRGIFQEDSSPYGGVLYAGYGGEFGESGGYSIGFTGYFYTEDDPTEPTVFDDTYTEVNLGISYDIFSLDVAIGEWDGFGTPADYTFTSVAVSPEVGPYYSYNTFGDDFAGDYIEIGYGWSAMDLDFSVAFMYDLNAGESDALLLDEGLTGFDDTAITFGIGKTFALD